MDSLLNAPDPLSSGGALTPHDRLGDGPGEPILLPGHVSTQMAEDLRVRLVFAADHEEAIVIDAAQTESIGQAGLQLLIAAKQEAERLDLPFAIENLSEALAARFTALGIADALGLTQNGTKQEELA
jgi:anti-anti-sigma regulatory factor